MAWNCLRAVSGNIQLPHCRELFDGSHLMGCYGYLFLYSRNLTEIEPLSVDKSDSFLLTAGWGEGIFATEQPFNLTACVAQKTSSLQFITFSPLQNCEIEWPQRVKMASSRVISQVDVLPWHKGLRTRCPILHLVGVSYFFGLYLARWGQFHHSGK